ncbi:hypothetical protein EIP91_007246 [Steccherinum ochraceum]|uniref:Uncharacterized protein n=1 Tax=Steccherinum ochraceum TaxID=92696 RepID=A0A4R0REZ9_9APHY|nr:hypothetical protein EIP91_007246 [Steccherinum ochraceum]
MVATDFSQDIASRELLTIIFQEGFVFVYVWEFIVSLDFDWSFINRQKRFTWPMIPYFGCRYLALVSVVMLAPLDICCSSASACAAYNVIQILTCYVSGVFAGIILVVRAMGAWSFDRRVVIPLILLIIGHWILILFHISLIGYVDTHLPETLNLDLVSTLNFAWILLVPSYALAIDIAVFSLTLYKLWYAQTSRTHLMTRIVQEGLIYILLTAVANAIAIIPYAAPESVYATFPRWFKALAWDNRPQMPTIAIAILACRLVRRLSNFTRPTHGQAVYITTQDHFAFQPLQTNNVDLDGDLQIIGCTCGCHNRKSAA